MTMLHGSGGGGSFRIPKSTILSVRFQEVLEVSRALNRINRRVQAFWSEPRLKTTVE